MSFIKVADLSQISETLQKWFFGKNPWANYKVHPVEMGVFCLVDKGQLNPYISRVFLLYEMNGNNIVAVKGYNRYESDEIETFPPKIKFQEPTYPPFTPITIPWAKNYHKMKMECPMDNLKARVDQIYNQDDPTEDMELMFMLLFVGHQWCEPFFSIQQKKEQINLVGSEDAVVECLRNNGVDNEIEGTYSDFQAYFRDNPDVLHPPKHWFRVHFSELPTALVDQKLIYEGGFCHLHWKEMGLWCFRRVILDLKKRSKIDHPPGNLDHLVEYMYRSNTKRRKKAVGGLAMTDLPPCMQQIINATRFPTDMERNGFVRTASRCGVPLVDVEDLFIKLNDKYPHRDGNIPLKRRFDLHYQYNKGYAPPKCEQIGWCPFEGDKRQCHQGWFKKKEPEKYKDSQAPYFKGPADYKKFY